MRRRHHGVRATSIGVVALLLATVGGGCATSVDLTALGDSRLDTIQTAFDEIVDRVHVDPEQIWQSGLLGNMWINSLGSGNMGLCYHWQELVYYEIRPTVIDVGWAIDAITINNGTHDEHHAVIVYDPTRMRRPELLTVSRVAPVYVLDAWRRGRADIFHLADWITFPHFDRVPAALEEMPETMAPYWRTTIP